MIPTPPRLRSAALDLKRIARDMAIPEATRLEQIAEELREMADGEEERQRMRSEVAGAEVKVPKREERKE